MPPTDRLYSPDHLWVQGDAAGITVGLTESLAAQLTFVTYLRLPRPGAALSQGEAMGLVEAPKVTIDLVAPVSGVVTSVNAVLHGDPQLVRQDPYGQGWLITLQPAAPDQLQELLDAGSYSRQPRPKLFPDSLRDSASKQGGAP